MFFKKVIRRRKQILNKLQLEKGIYYTSSTLGFRHYLQSEGFQVYQFYQFRTKYQVKRHVLETLQQDHRNKEVVTFVLVTDATVKLFFFFAIL